jgi:hypothetical protein
VGENFSRYGASERERDYIAARGGRVVSNSLEDDLVIFKASLRIVLEHGWVQGRGGNLVDGVCLRGAMQAASLERYTTDFVHQFHPVTWAFIAVRILPHSDIPHWNDALERTEPEVIALLRAIIAHIEQALGVTDTFQEEEKPVEAGV